MKKKISMLLAAVSIFALPVIAQAASLEHTFEATRTRIRGTLYTYKDMADAKTVNLSNNRRVAVTIQAYSRAGNYDTGSWKRNDGTTAYVKSTSTNVKTWESAHSTSGTSDAWKWLHMSGKN